MNRTVMTCRVGADGILSLVLPLSPDDANSEVRVTIEPVAEKPAMSQEEWAAWVEKMAGSIKDPAFRRHEQGEFEVRDELP